MKPQEKPSPIKAMLKAWEKHIIEHPPRVERSIPIAIEDAAKLEALAEVYKLPVDDITANLIASALEEVEAKMPYIPGANVIRTEEGEPIYDDAGPTPAYLSAKKRYEKQMQEE